MKKKFAIALVIVLALTLITSATMYDPKNEVHTTLNTAFVHGTDVTMVLDSATGFPATGGYIRISGILTDLEWALYEYTGISTNTLTGLTPCTEGNVESTAAHTFAAASIVELINAAEYLADIQYVIPGELRIATHYVDLATAISTIQTAPTTLVIEEAEAITSDLTIPTTMQLFFLRGGGIEIQTGSTTLTINGPPIIGLHQVFSGDGSVAFGDNAVEAIYPEWWGLDGVNDEIPINKAIAAACTALVDTGRPTVRLSGNYVCAGDIVNPGRGVRIEGPGKITFGTDKGIILTSTDFWTITNLAIHGSGAAGQIGILLAGVGEWIIDGVVFKNLETAIFGTACWVGSITNSEIYSSCDDGIVLTDGSGVGPRSVAMDTVNSVSIRNNLLMSADVGIRCGDETTYGYGGSNGNSLVIAQNTFESPTLGIVIEAWVSAKIRDNYYEGAVVNGVFTTGRASVGMVISGNRFEGDSVTGMDPALNLQPTTDQTDVLIESNRFGGLTGNAIEASPQLRNIWLLGNTGTIGDTHISVDPSTNVTWLLSRDLFSGIVNGHFTDGTNGWGNVGGSISVVGGNLRITSNGGSDYATSSVGGLTIGQRYRFTIEYKGKSGGCANYRLRLGTAVVPNAGWGAYYDTVPAPTGVTTIYFEATATDFWVALEAVNAGEWSDWDNATLVWAADNEIIGRLGIKTASPSTSLDVNDNMLRVRVAKTPTAANDTGNAGDFCWDATYFYICVATDTWERVEHVTWP